MNNTRCLAPFLDPPSASLSSTPTPSSASPSESSASTQAFRISSRNTKITNPEEGQLILDTPEYQLINLPSRLLSADSPAFTSSAPTSTDSTHTQPQLRLEDIPFRSDRCESAFTSCCGGCTIVGCPRRCPQDVVYRAYLMCGNILWASGEEAKAQRFEQSPLPARMMYLELTSEHPRYFAVKAMVDESLRADSQLDYSPQMEYEEHFDSKKGEWQIRPKVDPETGDILFLRWPKSGVCPYCLPRVTALPSRIRKEKK